MRILSFLALGTVFVLSAPAFAGTINYVDGRGTWQSTRCAPPQQLGGLSQNPEAAADDLNAQMAQHNAYAAAAQNYMSCLSQEAQGDADSAGKLITSSAQAMIQQMQTQVGASSARLQYRP